MLHNQSQECYTSSWNQKVPVAVLGIILYGIGIPLTFWAILYKYRNRLNEEMGPVGRRLGSIYYCYSNKRWYWEVVVKLRKFALVIFTFIFDNGDEGRKEMGM